MLLLFTLGNNIIYLAVGRVSYIDYKWVREQKGKWRINDWRSKARDVDDAAGREKWQLTFIYAHLCVDEKYV